MDQTNKNPEVTNDSQDNIIRFNMKADENIRSLARRGYQVSKNLKEAGLKFKRVIPACSDAGVRKQFRIPATSELLCLEIDYNKSPVEKALAIEDIKNSFLILDNFKLVAEGQYAIEKMNLVYRFLFKHGPNAAAK